jgi:cullin-4
VESAILQERSYTLDAAVVRLMKVKRWIRYEELKAVIVDAVRRHFVLDVRAIKQRVHHLVETEYIARNEDDRGAFTYVA